MLELSEGGLPLMSVGRQLAWATVLLRSLTDSEMEKPVPTIGTRLAHKIVASKFTK
jgi:hypothetical protein